MVEQEMTPTADCCRLCVKTRGFDCKISVVIPNFNGEKTVLRSIGSVYEQGIGPLEIIMVDDCSTDKSIETVSAAFPEVKIVRCEKKAYAAGARNIGFKHACGENVLFLDNDVSLLKNCLYLLLEKVERFDITYPKLSFENGVIYHPASRQQENYPAISGAFVIKREAADRFVERYGELFDEAYEIYWEDYEFFLRCRLLGLSALYVPDSSATHVIKQFGFRGKEQRFYREFRNFIYSCLKYRDIDVGGLEDVAFVGFGRVYGHLLKMLCVNTLLNYSGAERFQSAMRANSLKNKLYLALFHAPITNKTQVYLFYLALKAIYYNISNLRRVSVKNKELKSIISNMAPVKII